MKIEIQPNEKREHFIWRVYKYRDDTGKIKNPECGEICREQLNENYDESAYRKKYEYFLSIWNNVQFEYIKDDITLNRIQEIEDREDELYKTKVKTFDWLREKRKYLREEARIDHLKESFIEALNSVEDFQLSKYKEKLNGLRTGILSLSDWHIGLDVKNHWNVFNKDIAVERIDKLLQKTIKHCITYNIKDLYVLQLGDLISGSIHASTRLAEEYDTIEQTMFASKLLYKLLFNLKDFGLNIKYVSVLGNHDRKNKNYKESIEKESFIKIIDWYIQEKINDGKLDIEFIYNDIDDEIGMFEIEGKKCLTIHGHNDNMGTVCSNLGMALGFRPYAVFGAHWHKHMNIPQGFSRLFINGSLCGIEDYAKKKRFFSSPSQSLLILDEDDDINIKIDLK